MRVLATAALLLLISCFGLAGCSKPTAYRVSVKAAEALNPNVVGQPSPLQVSLFELSDDKQFRRLDFRPLTEEPKDMLGADLIAVQSLTVVPGADFIVMLKGGDGVKFVGMVAGYRKLRQSEWRALLPVENGKKNKISIVANELAISASAK